MYIRDVLIRDLANFKGNNPIHFFDGVNKGLPNELYVFVGENNSGKTSLLELIRACTDLRYLKEEWKRINVNAENTKGIVLCRMVTENREVITGFYKNGELGVFLWATPVEEAKFDITYMKLGDGDVKAYFDTRTHDIRSNNDLDELSSLEHPLGEEFASSKIFPEIPPWEECSASLPFVIMSGPEKMQSTLFEYLSKATSGTKLQNTVSEIVQRIGYGHYELSLEANPNKQHVEIKVYDKNTGKSFDYEQLPEGHQYLWDLAIHMARVKCSSEIGMTPKCLIMDEPTRCMHPSLIQHLSAEMKDYCRENELQFILTSHSPAVVRSVCLSNVYLAARVPDGSTTVRYIYDGIPDYNVNLNKKDVIGKRMEEIIFARIVMIVEGEGDRILLSSLLSRISKNGNAGQLGEWIQELLPSVNLSDLTSMLRDLTVVSAGGKDSVLQVVEPLETLNIPYFMVVDGDFIHNDVKQFKQEPSLGIKIMETGRVCRLFTHCYLLKDDRVVDLMETLSAEDESFGKPFKGWITKKKKDKDKKEFKENMSFLETSHRNHTSEFATCDCPGKDPSKPKCKETVGNILETGSKSMTYKRLCLIMEASFRILLPERRNKLLENNTEQDFASYATIYEEWFRMFMWRHKQTFDLE